MLTELKKNLELKENLEWKENLEIIVKSEKC